MSKKRRDPDLPPTHDQSVHLPVGTSVWLRRRGIETPIRGMVVQWYAHDNPLRCVVLVTFDAGELEVEQMPGGRVVRRFCCEAFGKTLVGLAK